MKRIKDLALIKLKEKHPNFPDHALPIPKYSDKTANGLTKSIVDFLNFSSHQAERISTTGRYIDNSIVVTDVLGRQRTIGSGKYIPSTSTKGSADISATIKGMSVKIEVKMKDKQSEYQKKYQKNIEAAGGQYWLVHSFDEFIIYYDKFLINFAK